MWEIVTVGGAPYSEIQPEDIYNQLMSGMRLPRPPHCAKPVYDIMDLCWDIVPENRPLFSEICALLNDMNLSKMVRYLVLLIIII